MIYRQLAAPDVPVATPRWPALRFVAATLAIVVASLSLLWPARRLMRPDATSLIVFALGVAGVLVLGALAVRARRAVTLALLASPVAAMTVLAARVAWLTHRIERGDSTVSDAVTNAIVGQIDDARTLVPWLSATLLSAAAFAIGATARAAHPDGGERLSWRARARTFALAFAPLATVCAAIRSDGSLVPWRTSTLTDAVGIGVNEAVPLAVPVAVALAALAHARRVDRRAPAVASAVRRSAALVAAIALLAVVLVSAGVQQRDSVIYGCHCFGPRPSPMRTLRMWLDNYEVQHRTVAARVAVAAAVLLAALARIGWRRRARSNEPPATRRRAWAYGASCAAACAGVLLANVATVSLGWRLIALKTLGTVEVNRNDVRLPEHAAGDDGIDWRDPAAVVIALGRREVTIRGQPVIQTRALATPDGWQRFTQRLRNETAGPRIVGGSPVEPRIVIAADAALPAATLVRVLRELRTTPANQRIAARPVLWVQLMYALRPGLRAPFPLVGTGLDRLAGVKTIELAPPAVIDVRNEHDPRPLAPEQYTAMFAPGRGVVVARSEGGAWRSCCPGRACGPIECGDGWSFRPAVPMAFEPAPGATVQQLLDALAAPPRSDPPAWVFLATGAPD